MEKYNEQIGIIVTKMGLEMDELPNFIKDYLINIEEVATEIESKQNEANMLLKKNKFNASYVSKRIKCSRTTLYNNEILKNYITIREEELAKKNPLVKFVELRETISDMGNEISLLQKRDVEVELLVINNEELAKELRKKKDELDALKVASKKKDNEIRNLRKNIMKNK